MTANWRIWMKRGISQKRGHSSGNKPAKRGTARAPKLELLKARIVLSDFSAGPEGVNARGSDFPAGIALTGNGISIGQVEPTRPGLPQRPGLAWFDSPAKVNTEVKPTAVYVGTDGTAAIKDNEIDNHAEGVAGVMIASGATDKGIAPDASLYSSAQPTVGDQIKYALALQQIASQGVRATNMSFLVKPGPGDSLNGNSLLTMFVDWSAQRHNLVYVVGGSEDNPVVGHTIPNDEYNGLTVSMTRVDADTLVYRTIDSLNIFQVLPGSRRSIDLAAPGRGVAMPGINNITQIETGTSFAAPHVTGAIALLHEYAKRWGAQIPDHRVIKAVLMNSADKLKDALPGMKKTILKKDSTPANLKTWENSDAADDPTTNDP